MRTAVCLHLALGRGRVDEGVGGATYRAYRGLIHGLFVFLVAFVFCGGRIGWGDCLSGFAWRAGLLLYCLPAWIALVRTDDGDRLML